jgi:hypothetical protein
MKIRQFIVSLSAAMPMLLLVSCGGHIDVQPTDMRMLSIKPEPNHEAALSQANGIHPQLDRIQVVERLRQLLARDFDPHVVSFTFKGEKVIKSADHVFLRQEFEFVNSNTAVMYGACTQPVLVLFNISGEMIGSYVEEGLCPV